MLDFFHHLKKLEGYMALIQASNLQQTIQALIDGEDPDLVFWSWAYDARIEGVLSGMERTVHRMMTQNGNGTPGQNEIILTDVAPAVFLKNGNLNQGETILLASFLSRLNRKYYSDLRTKLQAVYGSDRIHFLDVQNEFVENIMGHSGSYPMSYYFGASYTPIYKMNNDGIHFSDEGNRQFAKMLAAKMAYIGWFASDLDAETLAGISEGIPQTIGSGGGGSCDILCACVLLQCWK